MQNKMVLTRHEEKLKHVSGSKIDNYAVSDYNFQSYRDVVEASLCCFKEYFPDAASAVIMSVSLIFPSKF